MYFISPWPWALWSEAPHTCSSSSSSFKHLLWCYLNRSTERKKTKKQNKKLRMSPGHLFELLSLFNVGSLLMVFFFFFHFSSLYTILTLFRICIQIQYNELAILHRLVFRPNENHNFIQFHLMTFPPCSNLFVHRDILNILLISSLLLFFLSSSEM